jgi:hypothetical protein
MDMATTYKQAVTTLTEAIDNLDRAYRSAYSMDDKNRLFSMRELLQEELDTVLAAGLSDSRSGYRAQTPLFKVASNYLTQSRDAINYHVNHIRAVGQVADSLAKVVRLLA